MPIITATTSRAETGLPAEDRRAQRRRRGGVVLGASALAAAGLVAVAVLWPQDDRVFAAAAAFHERIVEGARLDPESQQMAALLAEPAQGPILNLNAFGNPVYTADASTSRHEVEVLRRGTEPGDWGDNVLAHERVPIPDGAEPATGSDGKLIIVDDSTGQVFDLWRAERVDGRWQAEWGGIYPLDGNGSSSQAAYGDGEHHVPWPQPLSRGTGSGLSSLAGVIRVSELEDGVIPHALAFSTDRACGPANSGPFRWPATTTDGTVEGQPCLPQGARVRLDPEIDLDALPQLTDTERAIGRALQDYGAYVSDRGGSRMAFAVEAARTAEDRSVLRELDLVDDYHPLPGLPMEFAVLASWDGS